MLKEDYEKHLNKLKETQSQLLEFEKSILGNHLDEKKRISQGQTSGSLTETSTGRWLSS